MLSTVQNSDLNTCSASTTASNSVISDFSPFNDVFSGEVICDWLTFRHDFDIGSPQPAIKAGKTLKINTDGTTEWEKQDFTVIRCPSSDTSIRVKCDGRHLWFSGNVGRFQQTTNTLGLSVIQCFEKAVSLLRNLYPDLDYRFFGTVQREGTIAEYGTVLTRLDLASNFQTDSYLQLSQVIAQRKIFRHVPKDGKYGAIWGYDSKRGQYWKAKLYDKQAEQDGKRTPYTHDTLARFEIQLGSEYLRQNKLNRLKTWGTDMQTENIIYGRFSNQIFREQATIEDWSDFPPKLRQHAIMWRDGLNPKSYLAKSQYYKVKSDLLDLGLDISRPCNVMTLTQKVKTITVTQAPTLRRCA